MDRRDGMKRGLPPTRTGQTAGRKHRRRTLSPLSLALVLVAVAVSTLGPSVFGNPGKVVAQEAGQGAIIYEDGFDYFTTSSGVYGLANGWDVWCVESGEPLPPYISAPDEPWKCPEYKQASPDGVYPDRVYSGSNAQQISALYYDYVAGIHKTLPIQPGSIVNVHLHFSVWSSQNDDPALSDNPEFNALLCLNPDGIARLPDNEEDCVIWASPPQENWTGGSWNSREWFELDKTVRVGDGGRLTILVGAAPRYPYKHNELYIDDLTVTLLESGRPAVPSSALDVPVGAGGVAPVQPAQTCVIPDPILEGLLPCEQQPAVTGGEGVGGVMQLFVLALLLGAGIALQRRGARTNALG